MSFIQFKDCRARWENDVVRIENDRILRVIAVSDGLCHTVNFQYKEKEWTLPSDDGHDFSYTALLEDYNGCPVKLQCKGIEGEIISGNLYQHDCLKVTIALYDAIQDLELNREYFIYPGIAAIGTRVVIKTAVCPNGYNLIDKNAPEIGFCDMENAVDILRLKDEQYRMRCVKFRGRTDYTNDLVSENAFVTGKDAGRRVMQGNLLFVQEINGDAGLFILQEAPSSSERRREGQGDFILQGNTVKSCGWGILPGEFDQDRFAGYLHITGCFSGNMDQGYLELRRYFDARFKMDMAKNTMIMANPWGGGGLHWQDNVGDGYIERELQACREMGIDYYQVDDGWQECRSLAELSLKNRSLGKQDWAVRRDIFPEGFSVIAAAAKSCKTELCLWFAPSFNKRYRDWAEQAELLFDMYKKYGIRIFKIDAMFVNSREAEENLRKLFSTLRRRSDGDIYFNLDTTNGMRPGYFMFHEYGNIFLENRYHDRQGATQYLPWRTLANLWSLSRYLPTQRLQIEFPDIAKAKAENYTGSAYPEDFSQEYVAAVSLFANPLFWGNPSECSLETKAAIGRVMDLHKRYKSEIFAGNIFPVGSKPDGFSWSGFQSHNPFTRSGFVVVYRELSPKETHRFSLKFTDGCRINWQCLTHPEEEREICTGSGGSLTVHLTEKNSFCLYRYRLS
ncbi:MAG: alpha-galactosidase [bacterium]|nr:alpha-galactosidase [bacterium]